MKKTEKKNLLPVISEGDLSLVEKPVLNSNQMKLILGSTPANHVYKRPAKGGGEWSYVTGAYVKKVLNLVFGWDWSFEVKEHKFDLEIGQAFVLGKLTVPTVDGKTIIKEQFGRVDIKFRVDWIPTKQSDGTIKNVKTKTTQPLDIGNDLKAATTDALKKCASELGVASDVYAPNEFKEVLITGDDTDDMETQISELLELKRDDMSATDIEYIEKALSTRDRKSYRKILKSL